MRHAAHVVFPVDFDGDEHVYRVHPINAQYDSSELEEELCPLSSSLPLRVHKVYIRVSFSDTFLRWLPPFVTKRLRVNFIFYVITCHCLAKLGLFIRS